MSGLSDIFDGIETVLKDATNGITGLQVYKGAPDSINSYPAAVIDLDDSIDPLIAFNGNTFRLLFRISLYISSGKDENGWRQLWDYIDPTQANTSVIKALRADRSLNGKADDSQIVKLDRLRRSVVGGGFGFAFDTVLDVVKTVA